MGGKLFIRNSGWKQSETCTEPHFAGARAQMHLGPPGTRQKPKSMATQWKRFWANSHHMIKHDDKYHDSNQNNKKKGMWPFPSSRMFATYSSLLHHTYICISKDTHENRPVQLAGRRQNQQHSRLNALKTPEISKNSKHKGESQFEKGEWNGVKHSQGMEED